MTKILMLILLFFALLLSAPSAQAAFPVSTAHAAAVVHQHKGLTPFFEKLGALTKMPRQMIKARKLAHPHGDTGDGLTYGITSLSLAIAAYVMLIALALLAPALSGWLVLGMFAALDIAAVVTGIMGLAAGGNKGLCITGLIMGGVGLMLAAFVALISGALGGGL